MFAWNAMYHFLMKGQTMVFPVQNDRLNMSWHVIGRDRKGLCDLSDL